KLYALEGGEAAAAGRADTPAADRSFILGGPRVLHLGVETAAIRTPHPLPLFAQLLLRIDRESRHQLFYLLADLGLDQRVLLDALLRQDVEHLGDHVAHFLEFLHAEAARRARRRAETDAGRDHRLFGVEGN